MGKHAFITGAGSGLGKEFAKQLATEGWELHLADLDLKTLEEVSNEMDQNSIHLYHLNVADKIQYEQVAQDVIKRAPSIHLVINNAGIGDGNFFHEYKMEDWEHMIHVNLMGTYYGCHFFVPKMLEQKSGLIINVGSAAGFMNAPGMSAYNVSKAGVYAFSETLYHELKSDQIHVSVLTPTFFKTNVMSRAKGSGRFKSFAAKQMEYSKTNAQEVAKITLQQAFRKKFQIIHPSEARRHYFIKKWFPKLIAKEFEKLVRKMKA